MSIEWSIIFLLTVASSVYFSYNSGIRRGIIDATILTLHNLEEKKIIRILPSGKIEPGHKSPDEI